MTIDIDIQKCELVDSLVRNVNDNFLNVSFEVLNNHFIQVKIILQQQTEDENEYIDDIAAEFSAVQDGNIVNKIEVTTNRDSPPLKYIVYSKRI